MYNHLPEQKENEYQRRVADMEKEVFTHLGLEYHVRDIPIGNKEILHTVFVPCIDKGKKPENYYMGHGFGGSSLMKFPIIEPLVQMGNVIFWQIRGMGMSSKLQDYPSLQLSQIDTFFVETIVFVLEFYQHNNATFICHSLSSYLVLMFTIKYPELTAKHIKELLLLSPIGITIKEEDYKNEIHSFSDVLHTIVNKFGWAFNLSYKSPLRTICSCCKQSLIEKSLKDLQLTQKEKEIMLHLVQTMILLPDGSQNLFFKYFEPRVLPKIPLQPLFTKEPTVKIHLVFGGVEDWVDKSGAFKISNRYPDKIKVIVLENCTHNIPFFKTECKDLFRRLLK